MSNLVKLMVEDGLY